MFDKILAKMQEQRESDSNVTDRTLEDLARTYETVISTDELLEGMDYLWQVTGILFLFSGCFLLLFAIVSSLKRKTDNQEYYYIKWRRQYAERNNNTNSRK